ncbi:MAG: Hsp20/alpha crystallin family protein [Ectothiorhodospiraceae bacterium]|nr:Hsp20/alpha crystallin family protein [Ectothiorhodospiraceae bacterium]MCH8503964.1 Hsp20/alpha crystallin family protein [Ectothiorhodospiraceae bacterium]
MVQQKSLDESRQETPEKRASAEVGRRGLGVQNEYDRWFEDLFSGRWWQGFPELSLRDRWAQRQPTIPKVDVVDQDRQLVLRAEVPGIDRDNLEVSVTDNLVTIRGRSHHEEAKEEGAYYRREISHGAFERTIPLPSDVDADRAKASFRDGILELTLPKVKEVRRRRIAVE